MERTLVTGPSGTVGADVVTEVVARGHRVVAAARKPAAVANLPAGVEVVRFDFAEPTTFEPALAGVTKVFLMRPPAISDVRTFISPFIASASRGGVRHMAFLSVLGAEKNPIVPHHEVESAMARSGMAYTFVRPAWFMQNLATTYARFIRDGSEIPIPTGRAAMSLIDARDVAAVSAEVLTSPGHEGRGYTLTGSEAPGFAAVARVFSEVLDRPVRFSNPSILAYRRQMAGAGMEPGMINVTTAMYVLARLGLSRALTGDTQVILGRPPITLRQFVNDYRAVWDRA